MPVSALSLHCVKLSTIASKQVATKPWCLTAASAPDRQIPRCDAAGQLLVAGAWTCAHFSKPFVPWQVKTTPTSTRRVRGPLGTAPSVRLGDVVWGGWGGF